MDCQHTSLIRDIQAIKSNSPVILNLTNFVAMDFNANALLALGASPIMAHAPEELSELIQISNAVVINIGTLDTIFVKSIHTALDESQKFQKPVIFDPVGAGASRFRTETALSILNHSAIRVIRGNASEIHALIDNSKSEDSKKFSKGVDTMLSSQSVFSYAKNYVQNKNFTICVSGSTDFVFSKEKIASIDHGDPLMTQVTAMGCSTTAIIGAFLAVNTNAFEATLHAMTLMGIVGEIAKHKSSGPGSFRVQFLDSLANITADDVHNLNIKFL